tara:strand:- start:17743 stop:18054 length:312 start_codon:yes stop_codon:yes gene_type:complete
MDGSFDLAVKRTNFANDRTFLASIRTNAIFAGLSIILVKSKFYLPAIIILFFSICANLLIIREYLRNKKNEEYKYSSLIYSSVLVVVLCILLYTTILKYNSKK